MGEHLMHNQDVMGSMPMGLTNFIQHCLAQSDVYIFANNLYQVTT